MKTLRNRLTLTHALVALVAIVIVAVLTTVLVRRGVDQLATRQAQNQADFIAGWLAGNYAVRENRIEISVRLRQWLARGARGQPIPRHLQLLDETGRVIFDSQRPGLSDGQVQPIDGAASAVVIDGRRVGTVVIDVRANSLNAQESAFLARLYVSVIGGSLLAGCIALVVGGLIARRVTQPLRSLTLAARRLAAGQQHQPITMPADAELAELAHAFNTMAAELSRQEDLRRQLVADIAHELRTPLSVLRLQVESLEDGVEQPTPNMLSSLGHEVNLLARLVDDLRLLSLADAGQLSLTFEAVDPHEALARVAAMAVPRARQQHVDLRVEHNGRLPAVRADPQRLAQVLGNLVENALRYTPQGGQVTLAAQHATDPAHRQAAIVFSVSDTGPGIPAGDLPHIFGRFYRTDRARSRETGGSGLGLAIVQRLVEAQGGEVGVTSQVGAGTTFRVMLPVA